LAAQNAKNRKHIAWSRTFAELKPEKQICVSSAAGFPMTWVPVTNTAVLYLVAALFYPVNIFPGARKIFEESTLHKSGWFFSITKGTV
jgi:hypothetical protein